MSESLFFLVFSVLVIAVMLVDLGIFKKAGAEEVSFREAGFWSGAWVLLALGFYIFLRFQGAMVHGIQGQADLLAVQSGQFGGKHGVHIAVGVTTQGAVAGIHGDVLQVVQP